MNNGYFIQLTIQDVVCFIREECQNKDRLLVFLNLVIDLYCLTIITVFNLT